MATMRMRLQRIELSWIALVLGGMLVGAILVVGIDGWGQARQQASAPVTIAPPAQVSEIPGGRLGGIASADTANDYLVRESLARAATVLVSEPAIVAGRLGGIESADTANDWLVKQNLNDSGVIGGRLGGIQSADTANDAAIKAGSQRIVGPGEGINRVP